MPVEQTTRRIREHYFHFSDVASDPFIDVCVHCHRIRTQIEDLPADQTQCIEREVVEYIETAASAPPRYCRDCQHAAHPVNETRASYWRCRRFVRPEPSLVTGLPIPIDQPCVTQREERSACGPNGNYFEPFPSRINAAMPPDPVAQGGGVLGWHGFDPNEGFDPQDMAQLQAGHGLNATMRPRPEDIDAMRGYTPTVPVPVDPAPQPRRRLRRPPATAAEQTYTGPESEDL